MIKEMELINNIEFELMLNGFCALRYVGNGKLDEIITLEEQLEHFKTLRDKKELEKQIKSFEDMIKFNDKVYKNKFNPHGTNKNSTSL